MQLYSQVSHQHLKLISWFLLPQPCPAPVIYILENDTQLLRLKTSAAWCLWVLTCKDVRSLAGQNFKRPVHFSRFISQGCTPNHHFSATQHHAGPCAISSIWISKAKKNPKNKKHSLKCYTSFHCLPVWFISHTALELSFKNVHQIFSFSVQNPSMVSH